MDKELKHIKFIAACKRAGIHGGRKRTFFEVCKRAADKGNERAHELTNMLEDMSFELSGILRESYGIYVAVNQIKALLGK